uniref:RelE toxin of RelE / RelB toxin-antitoxin system n=1 Tax=Candidatus Kentrum sp. SD TaxID=2126332 RepID=A0A450YNH5_9GAMM|nr:MAG: RelE toxin of RelE / RelB toxin-antitoxin system [Candidatus Kentron sp. SD]VFK43104.1 MAG: RelE toxin of RelE / RelB toxin-antitoxin system [Candidatus Kentron sp. SD]
MQTLVELPEFQRRASALLTEMEKQNLIDYLAKNPRSGIIMRDTGGIRKFRWALGNKGKSSGARVIHYYHDGSMPLFLLTVFGKSEKDNLSQAERNELGKLTRLLVKNYGG